MYTLLIGNLWKIKAVNRNEDRDKGIKVIKNRYIRRVFALNKVQTKNVKLKQHQIRQEWYNTRANVNMPGFTENQ